MEWNILIVWAFFMGALWRASVWRTRFRAEKAQHIECHRNFERFLDSLSEEQVPVQGGRVIYLNPEVVRNGDDA